MSSLTRIAWKAYRYTQKVRIIRNITLKPGSLMEIGLNKVLGSPKCNAAERVSLLEIGKSGPLQAVQARAMMKVTDQTIPFELTKLENHERAAFISMYGIDVFFCWARETMGKKLRLPTDQERINQHFDQNFISL